VKQKSELKPEEAYVLHRIYLSTVTALRFDCLSLETIFNKDKPVHPEKVFCLRLQNYLTETMGNYAHTYESLTSQDAEVQQMFWYHATQYLCEDFSMGYEEDLTYEDFISLWIDKE
jgi:hypothetical protein